MTAPRGTARSVEPLSGYPAGGRTSPTSKWKASRLKTLALGRTVLEVPEAGRLCGLGRGASYAAAKRGEIPAVAIGRRLVVPTFRLLTEVLGFTPEEAGRIITGPPPLSDDPSSDISTPENNETSPGTGLAAVSHIAPNVTTGDTPHDAPNPAA